MLFGFIVNEGYEHNVLNKLNELNLLWYDGSKITKSTKLSTYIMLYNTDNDRLSYMELEYGCLPNNIIPSFEGFLNEIKRNMK